MIKEVGVYSDLTRVLQRMFRDVNKYLFNGQLPSNVVITVQSTTGAYGHFVVGTIWHNDSENLFEINLGAEGLRRGVVPTVATLIHECVHLYCFSHDIKDVSRGGRYHNKSFKQIAEDHLLKIEYDNSIGYSITFPTDKLIEFCEKRKYPNISLYRGNFVITPPSGSTGTDNGDDDSLKGVTGKIKKVKKPSSTRKYVCPCCGLSVRATREVKVLCIECDKPLELVTD